MATTALSVQFKVNEVDVDYEIIGVGANYSFKKIVKGIDLVKAYEVLPPSLDDGYWKQEGDSTNPWNEDTNYVLGEFCSHPDNDGASQSWKALRSSGPNQIGRPVVDGDLASVDFDLQGNYGLFTVRVFAKSELGIRSEFIEKEISVAAPEFAGSFSFGELRIDNCPDDGNFTIINTPSDDDNTYIVESEFTNQDPSIVWGLIPPVGHPMEGKILREELLLDTFFKKFEVTFRKKVSEPGVSAGWSTFWSTPEPLDNTAEEWSRTKEYEVGDKVSLAGSSYTAIKVSGEEFDLSFAENYSLLGMSIGEAEGGTSDVAAALLNYKRFGFDFSSALYKQMFVDDAVPKSLGREFNIEIKAIDSKGGESIGILKGTNDSPKMDFFLWNVQKGVFECNGLCSDLDWRGMNIYRFCTDEPISTNKNKFFDAQKASGANLEKYYFSREQLESEEDQPKISQTFNKNYYYAISAIDGYGEGEILNLSAAGLSSFRDLIPVRYSVKIGYPLFREIKDDLLFEWKLIDNFGDIIDIEEYINDRSDDSLSEDQASLATYNGLLGFSGALIDTDTNSIMGYIGASEENNYNKTNYTLNTNYRYTRDFNNSLFGDSSIMESGKRNIDLDLSLVDSDGESIDQVTIHGINPAPKINFLNVDSHRSVGNIYFDFVYRKGSQEKTTKVELYRDSFQGFDWGAYNEILVSSNALDWSESYTHDSDSYKNSSDDKEIKYNPASRKWELLINESATYFAKYLETSTWEDDQGAPVDIKVELLEQILTGGAKEGVYALQNDTYFSFVNQNRAASTLNQLSIGDIVEIDDEEYIVSNIGGHPGPYTFSVSQPVSANVGSDQNGKSINVAAKKKYLVKTIFGQGSETFGKNITSISDAPPFSYDVNGDEKITPYHYKVLPYDDFGSGHLQNIPETSYVFPFRFHDSSNAFPGGTDIGPPLPVTGLNSTSSFETFYLEWEPSLSPDVASYEIWTSSESQLKHEDLSYTNDTGRWAPASLYNQLSIVYTGDGDNREWYQSSLDHASKDIDMIPNQVDSNIWTALGTEPSIKSIYTGHAGYSVLSETQNGEFRYLNKEEIDPARKFLDESEISLAYTTDASTTSIKDKGLTNEVKYFWVRAVDNAGNKSLFYPDPSAGERIHLGQAKVTDLEDFEQEITQQFENTIALIPNNPFEYNAAEPSKVGWKKHYLYNKGVGYLIEAGSMDINVADDDSVTDIDHHLGYVDSTKTGLKDDIKSRIKDSSELFIYWTPSDSSDLDTNDGEKNTDDDGSDLSGTTALESNDIQNPLKTVQKKCTYRFAHANPSNLIVSSYVETTDGSVDSSGDVSANTNYRLKNFELHGKTFDSNGGGPRSLLQEGDFVVAQFNENLGVKQAFHAFANAVIGSASIADAAITTAKIKDLAADRIRAGVISAEDIQVFGLDENTVEETIDELIEYTPGTDVWGMVRSSVKTSGIGYDDFPFALKSDDGSRAIEYRAGQVVTYRPDKDTPVVYYKCKKDIGATIQKEITIDGDTPTTVQIPFIGRIKNTNDSSDDLPSFYTRNGFVDPDPQKRGQNTTLEASIEVELSGGPAASMNSDDVTIVVNSGANVAPEYEGTVSLEFPKPADGDLTIKLIQTCPTSQPHQDSEFWQELGTSADDGVKGFYLKGDGSFSLQAKRGRMYFTQDGELVIEGSIRQTSGASFGLVSLALTSSVVSFDAFNQVEKRLPHYIDANCSFQNPSDTVVHHGIDWVLELANDESGSTINRKRWKYSLDLSSTPVKVKVQEYTEAADGGFEGVSAIVTNYSDGEYLILEADSDGNAEFDSLIESDKKRIVEHEYDSSTSYSAGDVVLHNTPAGGLKVFEANTDLSAGVATSDTDSWSELIHKNFGVNNLACSARVDTTCLLNSTNATVTLNPVGMSAASSTFYKDKDAFGQSVFLINPLDGTAIKNKEPEKRLEFQVQWQYETELPRDLRYDSQFTDNAENWVLPQYQESFIRSKDTALFYKFVARDNGGNPVVFNISIRDFLLDASVLPVCAYKADSESYESDENAWEASILKNYGINIASLGDEDTVEATYNRLIAIRKGIFAGQYHGENNKNDAWNCKIGRDAVENQLTLIVVQNTVNPNDSTFMSIFDEDYITYDAAAITAKDHPAPTFSNEDILDTIGIADILDGGAAGFVEVDKPLSIIRGKGLEEMTKDSTTRTLTAFFSRADATNVTDYAQCEVWATAEEGSEDINVYAQLKKDIGSLQNMAHADSGQVGDKLNVTSNHIHTVKFSFSKENGIGFTRTRQLRFLEYGKNADNEYYPGVWGQGLGARAPIPSAIFEPEEWEAGMSVDVGDLVSYNGSIYKSLTGTGTAHTPSEPGTTHWEYHSSAGGTSWADWTVEEEALSDDDGNPHGVAVEFTFTDPEKQTTLYAQETIFIAQGGDDQKGIMLTPDIPFFTYKRDGSLSPEWIEINPSVKNLNISTVGAGQGQSSKVTWGIQDHNGGNILRHSAAPEAKIPLYHKSEAPVNNPMQYALADGVTDSNQPPQFVGDQFLVETPEGNEVTPVFLKASDVLDYWDGLDNDPTATDDNRSKTITVTLKSKKTDDPSDNPFGDFYDKCLVTIVEEGHDGVSVVTDNDVVNVSASEDYDSNSNLIGVVDDDDLALLADIKIYVLEGAESLEYADDMTGKKGVFQVTGITEQNITKGNETKTDGNTFYEHESPTGFVSDQKSAYLDFNISYITNRGGSGTIVQRQTFSKGAEGLSSKLLTLESSASSVQILEGQEKVIPNKVEFKVHCDSVPGSLTSMPRIVASDNAVSSRITFIIKGFDSDGVEIDDFIDTNNYSIDVNEAQFLNSVSGEKDKAALWSGQGKMGLDKLFGAWGDGMDLKAIRVTALLVGDDGLTYSDSVNIQLAERGKKGNGVVFRGNWAVDEDYYFINEVRTDIVQHGGSYWMTKASPAPADFHTSTANAASSSNLTGFPNANSPYWQSFGATFKSVSTGLEVVDVSNINNKLNIKSAADVILESGAEMYSKDKTSINDVSAGWYFDGDGNFCLGKHDGLHLHFNGTTLNLVASTISASSISATSISVGNNSVLTTASDLNDLNDVSVAGATANQVLTKASNGWVAADAPDTGAKVTVSSTPPTNPEPTQGNMWWDTDYAALYIAVDIGGTINWVRAIPEQSD